MWRPLGFSSRRFVEDANATRSHYDILRNIFIFIYVYIYLFINLSLYSFVLKRKHSALFQIYSLIQSVAYILFKALLIFLGHEVMVSRMTLVLYILQSKDVLYIYEQPGSSLLWLHPRMERFMETFSVYRCWTWMAAFGAESPKGTVLVAPRPCIRKMARSLPDREWKDVEITTKKRSEDGSRVWVTGGRDLKASQTYTEEFGLSILSLWKGEPIPEAPCLDDVQIPFFWVPMSKKAMWDDARVTEVMQYLTLQS